jgi:crotonobetainyl-CoA:carnitine CoA-transferase CaiB-like acyl-CoA transferase
VGIFESHYYKRFLWVTPDCTLFSTLLRLRFRVREVLRGCIEEAQGDCDIAEIPKAADQMNRMKWPALRTVLTTVFLRRTRDEWVEFFRDKNVCVSPVLDPEEVECLEKEECKKPAYPEGGIPRIVPVLSDTPAKVNLERAYSKETVDGPDKYCLRPGEHTIEILKELGYSEQDIEDLLKAGRVQAVFPGYAPQLLRSKL